MGITSWQRRGEFADAGQAGEILAEPAAEPEPVVDVAAPTLLADTDHPAEPVAIDADSDSGVEPAADVLSDSGKWGILRQRVSACTACELHERRKQAVLGGGDTAAAWMLIGEAPGEEEDERGEPFIGQAGHLLDEMLQAAGIGRSDIYLANTVKCRPPNDDDPSQAQIAACAGFLDEQIDLVKPDFILALGKAAASRLTGLKESASLKSARGKVHYYRDTRIPVVVTYHPAYYLRSPREKRKGWEDLLFARKVAAGEVT